MPEQNSEQINPFEGISLDDAAVLLTQDGEEETSDDVETVDEAVEDDDNLDEQDLEADDEEESDSEDEDSDEESDEDDDYFEIDGETVSATQLKEWKDSGLRLKDYTQKTQQVAEERKQVQAALQQQVGLNQQYEQAIQQAQVALAAQMFLDGQTDEALNKLRQEDFDEYLRVKEDVEVRRKQMHGLMQEQARLQQEQQKAQKALLEERQGEAFKVLMDRIPGFNSDESRPAIQKGVASLLTSEEFGFSQQELDALDDPRYFMVAHALFEARQEKQKTSEKVKALDLKKVKKKVAPVLKGGTPKSQTQRRAQKVTQLTKRAAETGDFDSAVAALAAGMSG